MSRQLLSDHKFSHFSLFNRRKRLDYLYKQGLLNHEDVAFLCQSLRPRALHCLEKFSENVIGAFPMPLAIVPGFSMDKKVYTVPMVTEETSIIAGLSKMAKWLRAWGEVQTSLEGCEVLGQIQFPSVRDFKTCQKNILKLKNDLIKEANRCVQGLVRRGGGVTRLTVRKLLRPDKKNMLIIHVYMNPCDAMGANLMNQVCEKLRPLLEKITQEKTNLCIVSNLVDSQLTRACVILPLKKNPKSAGITPVQAKKIVEASLFAQLDPYRAATSNKGVMNGIDALLIATGNDFRAVEAGLHAYACQNGRYKPLTQWAIKKNHLIGTLTAPIITGTVGGVTALHPTVQLGLKLSGIQKSTVLSRLCAAVGLVQNLAALYALTGEGIVAGHMKLHIQNLLLASQATAREQPRLAKAAHQWLKENKKITQTDMQYLLDKLRAKKASGKQ